MKDLALKASPLANDDDEIKDEEMVPLSRKFIRFFIIKREGMEKNETNDVMKCYKC